jgi:TRAP-type C4-dicarboxylate transport system permease small subunit
MDKLRAVYKAFCKVELVLCGAGFIALVFLVFLSSILRMFRVSMSWNIDLAMLLLAWTAFLGADMAYRAGQLVGIDLVTRNLPKPVRKVIDILLSLVTFAALGIIVYFGIRLSVFEWVRTYQSMPIPFSVVTLSLVVMGASMLLSTIIKIKNSIQNFNKDTESSAEQAGLT